MEIRDDRPAGLGLRAGRTGKGAVLFKSKRFQLLHSFLYHLPNTRVSGVLAVEMGVQKGAEPSIQGRLGRNPRHPHLGCWFVFLSSQGRGSGQLASLSRIAYILELKIHGGSNVPVCTAEMVGEALTPAHTHTHSGVCIHVPHTRVCVPTQYILTYILLKYICYLQYISIST